MIISTDVVPRDLNSNNACTYVKSMKEGEEKAKSCPICGCTEHRLIGCGNHWRKHKEGPDGRCIPR